MFEPASFLFGLNEETGVATITLNRPDRLNALTFEVYDELRRDLDDPIGLGVLNEYRDRRLILKVTHLLTR